MKPSYDVLKPDYDRQKPDYDHQKPDYDHQKPDYDHQKLDCAHQKPDCAHQKLDYAHQKLDYAHQKLAHDSWKLASAIVSCSCKVRRQIDLFGKLRLRLQGCFSAGAAKGLPLARFHDDAPPPVREPVRSHQALDTAGIETALDP